MCLSIFLFLSKLGKIPKILYPQEVWNIEKKIIFRKGYAEIHIQGPFFDNKGDI
jgi:hypothetical protein